LYKVSSKEAAAQFLVTQNLSNDQHAVNVLDNKIAELWNSKIAAVVACDNCNFVFADPFIAGDYEFYNLIPHATAESPENWKWEFDKTYRKITEIALAQKNLNLIEIGASTGDFIKRIANLISKKNILCLEHSEIGVKSIRKAGIEAHTWDFHDLTSKKEFSKKFDIICLFQVLEHLDKLEDTFKTFNFIAKPSAHLFIGVPNGRKIQFNETHNALLDIPPNHIGRYNKKSFEYLGGRHGWEIEEVAIEPYTALDVMKTVMYSQSLKKLQYSATNPTTLDKIKQYIGIKYLRLQALFMHRYLGEALWVHFRKSD
jgi:2-polyprenyl-3-methyl-5-hydroxy-6-metoxy-1,4-benzoquinol methylase